MYRLKTGIKKDPEKRWSLPDRVFFGYGACHILAGVFLEIAPLPGFYGERIVPGEGFWGNHVYVTNGSIVFDHHGYSARNRLVAHHWRGWSGRYQGWHAQIRRVDFSLLDTAALNARRMRGPDQYFGDPVERAKRFIFRVDHVKAARKAERIASS